jgi:hypothetical protein
LLQLTLLRGFIQLNVQPDLIQSGQKIIAMNVSGLKLRFLNYSSYLTGSLREIGEQYRISSDPHYFPESWNEQIKYNFNGEKPPLSEFFCYSDTNDDKEKKKVFHENLDVEWNLADQLIKSCRKDCELLSRSLLLFLCQCFELENKLASKTKKTPNAIHPFGGNLCSISGFTFHMYSFYFMNDFELYTVMNPYSTGSTQTSGGETEWSSWLEWKFPQEQIIHFFNSPFGQKSFGRRHVDAYSEKSKEVFQYKGCEVEFIRKIKFVFQK